MSFEGLKHQLSRLADELTAEARRTLHKLIWDERVEFGAGFLELQQHGLAEVKGALPAPTNKGAAVHALIAIRSCYA